MERDTASIFLIPLSLAVAAYNLSFLLRGQQELEAQLSTFREAAGEMKNTRFFQVMNLLFYGLLPLSYLWLLHRAGFTTVFLVVLGCKFFAAGFWSSRLQLHLVRGKALAHGDYLFLKTDGVVNVLLSFAVIYFVFQ